MSKAKTALVFIIFSVVIVSCGTKNLSTQDYIKWVNNKKNGLIVEKQIGKFVFDLQYKPLDYVAYMDGDGKQSAAAFEEKKKEYAGLEYYTFRFGSEDKKTDVLKNGIANDSGYYTRIQYFSSMVQKDMLLISGKDTVPCAISHFERTYKMASFNNLVLAFDVSKVKNTVVNKTLVYKDKMLGTGDVRLTIDKDAIAKIPTLKLL